MRISALLKDFLKISTRRTSPHKAVARGLLFGGKKYSLNSQEGYEEDCRIVPRSFQGDTFEIELGQIQKTITVSRIVRSCYTIEELLSD